MSELPKTFDPAEIEARWYAHWETNGLFRPDRPEAEPWTIVNPPPNVTGILHIGHALDNTLQDILTRHARLQGKDALWVVGVDHAGIATQMVVERQMALHQQKRTDFTREEFVAKVWEWKAESGGEITRQLRRLGCSMDWSREQFTMDPHFVTAVNKVFVDLYNTVKPDGTRLLYRDKRLVNWDPGLKTAISDLEVETREINGKFWHFRYPLEDGRGHISVATTRPETMLADMAVAVSPGDPRYADLVGKCVKLPITGRRVEIIEDEHADPELGSGAVKITPGHDFNDFEVGKRAGFKPADMLNMLDGEGRVVQTADGLIPEELLGLDRFDARRRVVELIEEAGLLEKVEDRVIQTPFGDRSGVVVEPWLTDQWYVDAETLAKPAIEAVRSGAIKIVPKSWEKTYFNWMENIQPWCVSRQLWWGHRIPAWYGPDRSVLNKSGTWKEAAERYASDVANGPTTKVFVGLTEETAISEAQEYYGDGNRVIVGEPDALPDEALRQEGCYILLQRDPDVLDTWFSSALWPFATLGWPDEEKPLPFRGGVGVGPVQADPGLGETDTPHPHPASGRSAPRADLNRAGHGSPDAPEGEGGLLARHYPNDVLISGFDILFFWDARMIMQGLHFMGEAPFKTLYLHGLVRAKDGSKMSKSKGNTVDPLGLIDRYGADALRFFLAAVESQGRDIKMDEKRVEGYRNFATKLWNAARFCQANGIGASATLEPPRATLAVNRWIVAETVKTVQQLDLAFADYRFDAAADTIYHFVWDRFCDWYLELIKPVSTETGKGEVDAESRVVAGWVLDQILVMLHPFMPFITEELWNALGERPYPLIVAKWPIADARALDPEAEREVEWLIRLITSIRAARAELNVPPSALMPMYIAEPTQIAADRLGRCTAILRRLARISEVKFAELVNDVRISIVVDDEVFHLPLEGVIDLAAERARLEKGAAAAEKEAASLAARLDNASFLERAKPDAVEKARADHAEKRGEAQRLRAALERLG